MDLSKEINALIEKQYNEIKQSGKVNSGIEKIVKEIRWEEPSLAQHVYNRLIRLAKDNGDLP
ncbi:MAG: hypothetical protein LUI87_02095 [Lachnospiraceae bacterium]|nr:hypothetical protein [Lachnospiraceae bacterium]